MTLRADYHMHTPLCRHATGSPEAYVAAALAAGLTEIGISDHSPMPMPFDDWRMELAEFPLYLDWVEAARRAGGDRLAVRRSLEVDWLEGGEAWIEQLVTMAPWDYLLGSVHYIGEWNFDNPAAKGRFADFGTDAAWDRYWSLFAAAARSGYFHIMAHPDLIKKFGHRPGGDLRRYYEPAIQAVVDAGIAIEINTAGLFKDMGEMYPAMEFVELACEAGVPLTINSDAHAPQEVGRAFGAAALMARRAGYVELVRFAEGRRFFDPLS